MKIRSYLTPGHILYGVLLLAPFVAGVVFYSRMPEQVPIHWNAANEPDNFAGRAVALFVLPAILLVLNAVVWFFTTHDPKKDNLKRSKGLLTLAHWFLAVLPLFMQAIVIAAALLPYGLNVGMIVMMGVGLLLALVGNYLPKCQPNYTVGIRLPWTLASEENWRRTHRFAGGVWVVGGLLIALFALTPWQYLDVIPLLSMVFIPAVYSFLLYCKEKKR